MFRRTDKKKNNKGFSLVELIVVIAIMAVLVAVLAPQFTKYIDQSRKSNDAAMVSGIVTAAQVGIADTTNYNIEPGKYKITLTKNEDAKITLDEKDISASTSDSTKNFVDAIIDTCGSLADLKVTANKWTNDTVEITIKYDGSIVTVEYSKDFAEYVNGTISTDDDNSKNGV